MKKPVICHLSDFSPEYPGTFIDSLLYIARYCRNRMQIETFCVFPDKAMERKWLRRFDEESISYAFFTKEENAIFSIRYLLQNYYPLIFHTHFVFFDIHAIFLKFLFYRKSKIIWHLHSLGQLTLQQRVKDLIKIKLLARRFGDHFIAVGHGVYHNSIERGFPHEKLVLVENGIDTTRFFLDTERQKYRYRSSNMLKRHIVFLLLGWDPARKGVDLFVKAAAAMIRNDNQNSLFFIVGRDETRRFVSQMPEHFRLGSALQVIDPVEDFSLLLNDVDVLVLASRREGLSYAVAEAMAVGKLVLCSDIPGVRETYGKAGGVWVFPSEDWEVLAELMKKAQEIPSVERESLGAANAQYIKEYFSLEKWTDKIGEIYSALLGK